MTYQKRIFRDIYFHISRISVIALCVSLFQLAPLQAQELGDHQYTSEAIERGSRIYSESVRYVTALREISWMVLIYG